MKHMLVELPICASLVVVVVVIVWLLVPPGLPQHLLLAVLVETARLEQRRSPIESETNSRHRRPTCFRISTDSASKSDT